MTAAEEWRVVPSHPDYDISSLGRVRSRRRKKARILSASPTSGGYPAVALRTDNRRGQHTIHVHALVAEAFHGPRPVGLEVRHLDGNPNNNVPSNIKYGTHGENLRDRVRHRTDPNAAKTHCPQRHPYDERNTARTRTGTRYCRTCNRERVRAYNTRRAFAAANIRSAA